MNSNRKKKKKKQQHKKLSSWNSSSQNKTQKKRLMMKLMIIKISRYTQIIRRRKKIRQNLNYNWRRTRRVYVCVYVSVRLTHHQMINNHHHHHQQSQHFQIQMQNINSIQFIFSLLTDIKTQIWSITILFSFSVE